MRVVDNDDTFAALVMFEKGATGVVDGSRVATGSRVELIFEGRADHSGATPMWLRRDALVAAAEFVVAVERRARSHAPRA